MSHVSRRKFLQQSMAFAGATFAIGVGGRPVLGANERINIGVVGVGGRGGGHLGTYMGMKDVDVTYAIDVDSRRAQGGRGRAESSLLKQIMREQKYREPKAPKDATKEEKARIKEEHEKKMAGFRKAIDQNRLPKAVQDVRKALEDKNLDALSCATPNHWHALMTIWAVQAEKDIYVEKPCSHNVFEGRIASDLIAKSKQIVQTGTQRRSESRWAQMIEITKSGKLGKLLISHGIASKPRGGIGTAKPEDPPKNLDWDLWVGPAPMQPYHSRLVHYNWHWFWDFGSGEIGNQGVHQTDVARWAIPGATHPTSIFSIGGRIEWGDMAQTPNTQLTIYDYGETLLLFEVCNLVGGKVSGNVRRVSNDFIYEAGKVVDGRSFYPKDGGGKKAPMPKVDVKVFPGGPFGNFINCVRSRKQDELNAPYLEGHYSAAICHLGNISYRLGKEVTFDKFGDKPFEGDYTNERWACLQEHLTTNRKLKLAECKGRVGLALKFDPEKEQFVGAPPEANKLLTRPARKPFDVPEKV